MIALVRHGEYHQPGGVPSAWLPHPLTPTGEEQCRAAARELATFVADVRCALDPVIDCSRMLRAWQTATLIAEHLSALGVARTRVEQFDDLAERSLGAGANLTVKELERIVAEDPRHESPPPGWKRNRHYRLPLQGAESLCEAGQRVARHLLRRAPDERTLKVFVGHGGAFRHAAGELGVLDEQELDGLSMYHGRPLILRSLSPQHWERIHGQWRVRSANALSIPPFLQGASECN